MCGLSKGDLSTREGDDNKEELPRPTTVDAVDGRLGLGRRRLLRVARRKGKGVLGFSFGVKRK